MLSVNPAVPTEWYISSGTDTIPAAVSAAVIGRPMASGYVQPFSVVVGAYLGFGDTVSYFSFSNTGPGNTMTPTVAQVVRWKVTPHAPHRRP
jgi:hypothetical protein